MIFSLLDWLILLATKCCQQCSVSSLREYEENVFPIHLKCLNFIINNEYILALLKIAIAGHPDQLSNLNTKVINYENYLDRLDLDESFKTSVKFSLSNLLHFHEKRALTSKCHLIESNNQSLNLSISMLCAMEAVHQPSQTDTVVNCLLNLEKLHDLKRCKLYKEFLRASWLTLHDGTDNDDEIKVNAHLYLKVPLVLKQMVQLESCGNLNLFSALEMLVKYGSLFDKADKRAGCNTLGFFLSELRDKHKIISEEQERKLHSLRELHSLLPDVERKELWHYSPSNAPSCCFIIKAQKPLESILDRVVRLGQEYDDQIDNSPPSESLSTILNNLISGKSFGLLTTAASFTMTLKTLTSTFFRFTQMYISRSESQLEGSSIFDISLLMLIAITLNHGNETLFEVNESDQKTALFSFLMTCLPDKFGKYMVPCMFETEQDESLVNYILENMLRSRRVPFREIDSNFDWVRVCFSVMKAYSLIVKSHIDNNFPDEYCISEIVFNIKSEMCSIAAVMAVWLCSYANLLEHSKRIKAVDLADHFSRSNTEDRGILLEKIVDDVRNPLVLLANAGNQHVPFYFIEEDLNVEDYLLKVFRDILSAGFVKTSDIHKFRYSLSLMNVQHFCKILLEETLKEDRIEDLTKGICILHLLFSFDREKMLTTLLKHTLPNMINGLGFSPTHIEDPKGRVISRLLTLMLSEYFRGREIINKRKLVDDFRLNDTDEIPSKRSKLSPSSPFHIKMETEETEEEDVIEREFSAFCKEFLMANLSCRGSINKRIGFVYGFISEMITAGQHTINLLKKHLPASLLGRLIRLYPGRISLEQAMSLCNLDETEGRLNAAEMIIIHSNHIQNDVFPV
ncbi:DgyrCDS6066 [Dimorphilus gyrociliatus]|nr:DgyrCDS6066 [Dimorphilus gyrociliatus]